MRRAKKAGTKRGKAEITRRFVMGPGAMGIGPDLQSMKG